MLIQRYISSHKIRVVEIVTDSRGKERVRWLCFNSSDLGRSPSVAGIQCKNVPLHVLYLCLHVLSLHCYTCMRMYVHYYLCVRAFYRCSPSAPPRELILSSTAGSTTTAGSVTSQSMTNRRVTLGQSYYEAAKK